MGKLITSYCRDIPYQCDDKRLLNGLIIASQQAGATVFSTDCHSFFPVGLSGTCILGESHSAIHTFPEKRKAWLEIATSSGRIDPDKFFWNFRRFIQ